MNRRKSWVEKRDLDKEAVVKKLDKDFADMHKGEKMLIATSRIVDAYIRHIPRGRQQELKQMRTDLAVEYGADVTCPVTSGIFLRIVAEAAWEEYQQGKSISQITPFWRMMSTQSPTAKKLSFGLEFLKKQREKEKLLPL